MWVSLDKRIFPWNHANCGDLNLSGERRPQSICVKRYGVRHRYPHIVVTPPVPSFPLNRIRRIGCMGFSDVVDHWNFGI